MIPGTGLQEVSSWQIALPHLELLVFILFFIGLALLLSQLLPSRAAATALSSLLLVACYILKTMLELDDRLEPLEKFSPLSYLKGGYAIAGLNANWLLGLLGFGLLFIVLAAWRFERRDLRVSGEGNWPTWTRLGKGSKRGSAPLNQNDR